MLNEKQVAETNKLLRLKRYELIGCLPYLARILFMLKFQASEQVESLATSKQCVVLYNPSYVEKCTDAELGGVLLHECLHILCQHWARVGDRDHELFNVSGDISINQIVENYSGSINDIKLPANVITFRSFKPHLPENLTAEEYYDLLQNMSKQQQQQGKNGKPQVGSGNCGSCAGKKGGEGKGDSQDESEGGNGNSDRYTEDELNAASYSTAMAISEACKTAGNIPLGLQRWMEMQIKPPKVKWSNILRTLIHRSLAVAAGKTDYTYTKPSRRQAVYGYGPRAPILPSLRGTKRSGVVAVDTSGSMGKEELTAAVNETKGIIDAIGGQVDFYTCDTQIHSAKKVSNVGEILANMKGGGGTELSPIFDRVKQDKLKPSFIVVITDGCCSVPQNQPSNIPVFYVIVGKGNRDPGFKGKVLFANKD